MLAGEGPFGLDDVSHSKVFAEPSESLDASALACASGLPRIFASAFVVDDEGGWAEDASSEARVWRNPVT